MNRTDKNESIEQLNATLSATPHVILATFRGLSVNQATELRGKIREIGGSYRVIKNRLARRAAEGTSAEKLIEKFSGPCALATHAEDPVVLAKTLSDFAKDNPQIELLAGVIDARDVVDDEGVKQLAQLPALPELRAQLLSLIQTPATTLVRLLQTPGEQIARVMNARGESQGEGAES